MSRFLLDLPPLLLPSLPFPPLFLWSILWQQGIGAACEFEVGNCGPRGGRGRTSHRWTRWGFRKMSRKLRRQGGNRSLERFAGATRRGTRVAQAAACTAEVQPGVSFCPHRSFALETHDGKSAVLAPSEGRHPRRSCLSKRLWGRDQPVVAGPRCLGDQREHVSFPSCGHQAGRDRAFRIGQSERGPWRGQRDASVASVASACASSPSWLRTLAR